MEFFIFLCFMSFVSFAVAFPGLRTGDPSYGTTSSASRYSQIILVPIAIIGYDFLTITAPGLIPLCYRRAADTAFRINAAVLPFW